MLIHNFNRPLETAIMFSLKLRRLRACLGIYRVLTHFWSNFTDHERKTSLSYRWVFNLLKTLILQLEVELRVRTFTKSP